MDLPLHELLGYLGLFIGSIIEGETVVITASFAAHRGYLNILFVFIVAMSGTLISDWFWFIMGRKNGQNFVNKKPKLRHNVVKIDQILNRNPVPLLIGYRFLYGLRTMVPLVIGISSIKFSRFLFYSTVATVIWASVMCGAGYFFGAALEANFARLEHYEIEIMSALLVSGAAIILIFKIIKRRSYETP